MDTDDCRYIDDVKAAKIRDCSPQTLRNDRSQGRGLPYYKIGRSVRYRLDEILAFMEKHRVVPVNSDLEEWDVTND